MLGSYVYITVCNTKRSCYVVKIINMCLVLSNVYNCFGLGLRKQRYFDYEIKKSSELVLPSEFFFLPYGGRRW